MLAREPLVVALAVQLHVEQVLGFEAFHHVIDVLHAAGTFTHDLRREVRVCAGPVPVREELGLEAHGQAEGLADAAEQIAAHPHVVANLDAKARTDLVLPLSGHDLRVGSRDFDAGEQTRLVVQVGNLAAEADVAAYRAVVRALLAGVAVGRPSQRLHVEFVLRRQESVLLFDAVPRFFFCALVEDSACEVSEVCIGGDEVLEGAVLPHPALGEHEDVVAAAEWVREECDRLEDDLGVLRDGLVG